MRTVEENIKNIKNQNHGTFNFSALIHRAEFEEVSLNIQIRCWQRKKFFFVFQSTNHVDIIQDL